MPNGIPCLNSPYIWTSANWSGKFRLSSDTVASVAPTLVANNDPSGTYNWNVTFSGNGQSVSKSFSVIYDPLETTVDVQPLNIKLSKTRVTTGDSLGIVWEIRNNGTLTAGSSYSQVRLTTSNAANGYGDATNNVGNPMATGTIAPGAKISRNRSRASSS